MNRTTCFLICLSLCSCAPRYLAAQAGSNQLPPSSTVPFGEEKADAGTVQEGPANPQSTDKAQAPDSTNNPQAQTEPNAQPQVGPKYEAYKNMLNEGREINREIDRLFGEMPIGFPDKQQEYQQKIIQLKARQAQLASQLTDAAIEAFQESPQADTDLIKFVFNKMVTSFSPQLETQKFNPQMTLKLAELLTENNAQALANTSVHLRDIYYLAFRAAFALQDFDKAETLFQKVEENSKTELPPSFRQVLEETRDKWNRELEIRRMEAATDDLPRVKFETTAGDFVVELFENHAPQTVGNFISLVDQGFYDGLTFHLVKPGILIQGGCPVGNGTGDPGYKIPCECYRDEIRHHFAGTISMSNKGRDTAGCQFFISQQPNPTLDGKYTVFGRVIENMDAIYNVNTVDKTKPNAGTLEPTVINRITVLRKRDHVYEPTIVAEPATADSGAPSEPPSSGANPATPDKTDPAPGDSGKIDPPSGGG